MLHTRTNHHEAALTLLQQLLLTGSLVIPTGIQVAKAYVAKKKGKKKS